MVFQDNEENQDKVLERGKKIATDAIRFGTGVAKDKIKNQQCLFIELKEITVENILHLSCKTLNYFRGYSKIIVSSGKRGLTLFNCKRASHTWDCRNICSLVFIMSVTFEPSGHLGKGQGI